MICIPDWQRDFHLTTEVASLLFAPLVLMAASASKEPHRTRLRVLGVGMLVVDGFLVLRWLQLRKRQSGLPPRPASPTRGLW